MPSSSSNVAFKTMLKGATKGHLVLPLLQAILFDPKFDAFSVPIPGFESRPPDGWFHPSTHPLWTPRQLYYYLTEPARMLDEPFDPLSTMAVTAGTFWHGFLQHIMLENGVLDAAEVPVQDDECGSRGHMDGLIGQRPLEIKTMNPQKFRKIDTLEDFRDRCPDYYAQGQDYLRMSGLHEEIILIVTTAYPFEMKELLMPADITFQREIETKYRSVRQAVADQVLPQPCCNPQSPEARACPARIACPIGLA